MGLLDRIVQLQKKEGITGDYLHCCGGFKSLLIHLLILLDDVDVN
jgi:hypothetical protein